MAGDANNNNDNCDTHVNDYDDDNDDDDVDSVARATPADLLDQPAVVGPTELTAGAPLLDAFSVQQVVWGDTGSQGEI